MDSSPSGSPGPGVQVPYPERATEPPRGPCPGALYAAGRPHSPSPLAAHRGGRPACRTGVAAARPGSPPCRPSGPARPAHAPHPHLLPAAALPAGEPPTCSGGAAAAATWGGSARRERGRSRLLSQAGPPGGPQARGAPGGGGAPPDGQAPPRAAATKPGSRRPLAGRRPLRVGPRRGGRERGSAQSPPPGAVAAGLPGGLGRVAGCPPPIPPFFSVLTSLSD